MKRLIGLAVVAPALVLWANAASAKAMQLDCVYPQFHDAEENRLQDAKGFNLKFTLDTVTR